MISITFWALGQNSIFEGSGVNCDKSSFGVWGPDSFSTKVMSFGFTTASLRKRLLPSLALFHLGGWFWSGREVWVVFFS